MNSTKHRRTESFNRLYFRLPTQVRRLAVGAYRLFKQNPHHRSLRLHALKPTKTGSHLDGSYSVSINMQYRAIYVVEKGEYVWYWIGSHAEYDQFVGR